MAVIYFFIQCVNVAPADGSCCSKDCIDNLTSPEEERKATRKGSRMK
jgi:hypothetical protein